MQITLTLRGMLAAYLPPGTGRYSRPVEVADAATIDADRHREAFIGLSDRVFDVPETLYNEYRSVAEHTAMLHAQGFRVTEGQAANRRGQFRPRGETVAGQNQRPACFSRRPTGA